MEKILITGVAGFIGSAVASRFYQEGYEVVGVDDLSNGIVENIPNNIEFIEADLARMKTIKILPNDCRRVLHLAGQSSGEISFDDPVSDLNKNTVSTLNLINYSIKNKVERFVYASSMSVYGHVADAPINEDYPCTPLSCYGVGKYAAENYLRVYQQSLPFVILRLFNVYGPGQDLGNLRQGMVSIYLAQALANGSIEVKGQTNRFRDFIFIDDVVETFFRAATYPSALNEILNVGTGVRTTVKDLLETICSLIPGVNFVVSGSTPGDQHGIYADNASLTHTLEMKKFTLLSEGLRSFVDWAKQFQGL